MRIGAPLSHVSSELRGPPWKSMARSYRSRLSRLMSARSASSRPRAPRAFRHDHFVEVGIVADDGSGFLFDDIGDAGVRDNVGGEL